VKYSQNTERKFSKKSPFAEKLLLDKDNFINKKFEVI